VSEKKIDKLTEKKERLKIRLQKEKSLRKKAKRRQIGKIKAIIFIIFLGIPFLYQLAYIDSLKGFTFSSGINLEAFGSQSENSDTFSSGINLETFETQFDNPDFNINDFIDEVQEYVMSLLTPIFGGANDLNVTRAFENILSNNSLLEPLETIIGNTISTLNEFKIALQNDTIPRHITDPIYEAVFRWEIPKIFPSSWDDIVYFYIGYNGIFPISDIVATIDLVYDEPIRLVENIDRDLSINKELVLRLKISTIMQGILQSSYRALINATYNSMVAGGFHFYRYIGEYFKNQFNEIGLFISVNFGARFGFLPINFKADVDLIWAIKLLIEAYL
jgi:hypothetical protein